MIRSAGPPCSPALKLLASCAIFDEIGSQLSSGGRRASASHCFKGLAKSSFDELLKTADAFYSDGKYMKAIDYYEQVQSRVPENEHIRLRIADCRQKLNAFVDIHFSKAINLYAAEDYSGAIRELEAVLEADPTHAGSREYLQKAQKRLIAIETLQ